MILYICIWPFFSFYSTLPPPNLSSNLTLSEPRIHGQQQQIHTPVCPWIPSFLPLMQVWDDAGTEGRAGSIWMVNSLHLMAAGAGHDPPQGPFWDMKVDQPAPLRVLGARVPS